MVNKEQDKKETSHESDSSHTPASNTKDSDGFVDIPLDGPSRVHNFAQDPKKQSMPPKGVLGMLHAARKEAIGRVVLSWQNLTQSKTKNKNISTLKSKIMNNVNKIRGKKRP